MSNKEKIIHLAETLDEANLAPIVNFADRYLKMLDDMLDDAYCEMLWEEAEADPDKDTLSLDECMKELGLSEEKLQS